MLISQQNTSPRASKVLLCVIATLLFSGCSVKKDFYASGGSRADGTVDMAYDFAQFEQPIVKPGQAQAIAKTKCRVWGYSDAEAFGGRQQNCHQFNGYGTCIAGQIVHKYQCIGNLNEAPQAQPSGVVPASLSGAMTKEQWRQQQLEVLKAEKGISYEEYTRRYRAIMAE